MVIFECHSCDVDSPCYLAVDEGGVRKPDHCPFIQVESLLQPPSWVIVEQNSQDIPAISQ